MAKLSDEYKSSLEAAVTKYEAALETASPYLESRGIDLAAARRFRLGVVSDPEPGHESGRGRLAIPYLTKTGPVAIKFRCIRQHSCKEQWHAKYAAPTGQEVKLYNTKAFFADEDIIAITEGEIDALILTEYCRIPAVGVPGAGNWKNRRHWPRMFSGYQKVLVFRDPDDAGEELAARIADSLMQATIIELPKDVNETFIEQGADYIRQMAGLR